MKFSIKGFFSKCDQIHRKLQIWSHLLEKSLMETFLFYAVLKASAYDNYRRLLNDYCTKNEVFD